MEATQETPATAKRPFFRRRGVLVLMVGLVLPAASVVAFYLIENSRGLEAWNRVKANIAAQHEPIDWADVIPPVIPDASNFFKAPKMQEWFTGAGSNELTARLMASPGPELAQGTNAGKSLTFAELILRDSDAAASTPPEIMDKLAFDQNPLGLSLKQLAKEAKLQVTIDPSVDAPHTGPDGKTMPAVLNYKWKNVTARAAFLAIVCDNNLRWVDDPKTGAIIKLADLTSATDVEDLSRDSVLGIIRQYIGMVVDAPQNFSVAARRLSDLPLLRFSVGPDGVPAKSELARFFPGTSAVQVEPAGDALRISVSPAPVAAADYLAWSERFSPDIDLIRQAASRPFARLDGNYQQIGSVPGLNSFAFRVAVQTIATRATACMMAGHPQEAVDDLTLLHDLRGCLEFRPAGKPLSWDTVMLDEAVGYIYSQTASYGLRAGVWREPELAVLQNQLSQIDYLALAWNALETDRAAECHVFETFSRPELVLWLDRADRGTNFARKLSSAKQFAVRFMPRGWIYQNMAGIASMDQHWVDAIDRLQGVLDPNKAEGAWKQISSSFPHASAYSFLTKLMMENWTKHLMATARNQAFVNETVVVCALERFLLAHKDFPKALDELAPRILPLLPTDPVSGAPLRYRRTTEGRFLLYSVGWDGKDNNGAPLDSAGNGDWVWGRL